MTTTFGTQYYRLEAYERAGEDGTLSLNEACVKLAPQPAAGVQVPPVTAPAAQAANLGHEGGDCEGASVAEKHAAAPATAGAAHLLPIVPEPVGQSDA